MIKGNVFCFQQLFGMCVLSGVPSIGRLCLRVLAIISITLEYKMRVINFITNYVGLPWQPGHTWKSPFPDGDCGLSACQCRLSDSQSIITRFGCLGEQIKTCYRSEKISRTNKIYMRPVHLCLLGLFARLVVGLPGILPFSPWSSNCQALRVRPSKCCTPHQANKKSREIGDTVRWLAAV